VSLIFTKSRDVEVFRTFRSVVTNCLSCIGEFIHSHAYNETSENSATADGGNAQLVLLCRHSGAICDQLSDILHSPFLVTNPTHARDVLSVADKLFRCVKTERHGEKLMVALRFALRSLSVRSQLFFLCILYSCC
jgi:hypothetical protein